MYRTIVEASNATGIAQLLLTFHLTLNHGNLESAGFLWRQSEARRTKLGGDERNILEDTESYIAEKSKKKCLASFLLNKCWRGPIPTLQTTDGGLTAWAQHEIEQDKDQRTQRFPHLPCGRTPGSRNAVKSDSKQRPTEGLTMFPRKCFGC